MTQTSGYAMEIPATRYSSGGWFRSGPTNDTKLTKTNSVFCAFLCLLASAATQRRTTQAWWANGSWRPRSGRRIAAAAIGTGCAHLSCFRPSPKTLARRTAHAQWGRCFAPSLAFWPKPQQRWRGRLREAQSETTRSRLTSPLLQRGACIAHSTHSGRAHSKRPRPAR